MKFFLAIIAFFLIAAGGEIDKSESFYTQVAGFNDEISTGYTPANGEKISITRFVATGSNDPLVYVMLVWCWGTGSQKIIASTSSSIDLQMNQLNADNQVVGNGSCKLQIRVDNDSVGTSNFLGGKWEAVDL